MKKILVTGLAVCAAAALHAAGFTAGQGIANDYATGANARDVTFVARGGGNGYGYRQFALPLGLTFLPWAVPNFESSVYGLRFDFGWGRYEGTYGIAGGAFCRSGEFTGIAGEFLGTYTERNANGIQVGLVNVVGGDASGLQVGAVNYAERLHGLQIGFLNFNRAGAILPVINFGL